MSHIYTYCVKVYTPHNWDPIFDNIISAGFCFINQRGEKIHTVKEFDAQQIPTIIIRAHGISMSLEWSDETDELIIISLLDNQKKDVDLSFYIRCALQMFKGLYIDKFKAERLEIISK